MIDLNRVHPLFCLLLLLVVCLAPTQVLADGSDLDVIDRDLVSSQRVNRMLTDFEYTITVRNTAAALSNVVGTVTSSSPNTTIVEGEIILGDVGANSDTQSTDTFTLRQNRRFPFNPEDLVYSFVADPVVTNAAPTADAGADQAVATGATVILNGSTSSDPENDPLTFAWTLTQRPSGSSAELLNSDQAEATFIADIAGVYVAQLVVNDGQLNSEPDTVQVDAAFSGDQPPVITSSPVTAGSINQGYTYLVEATDPDVGDVLTYSLLEAPTGMVIDSATGLINWTPDATGASDVILEVSDSTGLSDSQIYLILVNNGSGDGAPVLAPIANQTTIIGVPVSVMATGTDPQGEVLRYTLDSAPSGAAINPATGVFQWTPANNQSGDAQITVTVSDPGGQTASQTFAVTVLAESGNQPPVIQPVSDLTVTALTPIEIALSASDNDPNDRLVFSLSNLPDGLQFDPINGTVRWIPATENAGSNAFVATVTDSAGNSDTTAFTIQVLAPQERPNANDDAYAIARTDVLSVPAPGVLSNDTDANGDPLSAAQTSNVFAGTLNNFLGDGSFVYTPPSIPPITVGFATVCDSLNAGGGFAPRSVVGDFDNDDDTEIAVLASNGPRGRAHIVEVSQGACTVVDSSDALPSASYGTLEVDSISAADLDGDGDMEIMVGSQSESDSTLSVNTWVALDDQLNFLFRTQNPNTDLEPGEPDFEVPESGNNRDAYLTYVDLDADGTTEMVAGFYAAGGALGARSLVVAFNNQGQLLWKSFGDYQDIQSPLAYSVADIDLDGTMEVLYGTEIISHAGDFEGFWPVDNAGTLNPQTRVRPLTVLPANFDNDPFPEFLARDTQNMYLFDDDQTTVLWTVPHTFGMGGSREMVIGQFDNDPQLEIAVVDTTSVFEEPVQARGRLHVYEHDGSLKWRHRLQVDANSPPEDVLDPTSGTQLGQTPVRAFDFDQDGVDELVVYYRGAGSLSNIYIVDGADGSLVAQTSAFISGAVEPVIADVDNNGAAEIVWQAPTVNQFQVFAGLTGNPWPAARGINNQRNYHPATINADGSVPANPKPYWLRSGLNNVNKITVVPGEDDGTFDGFDYVANDGFMDSNQATVDITITPSTNPPVIISQPAIGASPGFDYTYGVLATDADFGDSFDYQLVNVPAGMVIDEFGVITWTPESGDLGENSVLIVVTDNQGNTDSQSYTLTVVPPVTVPDLAGNDETMSMDDLVAAGLALGRVSTGFSAAVPSGLVISQSVAAGDASAAGTFIDIVISLGPRPVFLPELVGLDERIAELNLTAVDLTLGTVTRINSDTAPRDTVISQSIAVGTQVSQGSAVDLTVSSGPAVELSVVRNLLGAGESTSFALQFFDSDGAPTSSPGDLITSLDPLEATSGAPPLVNGSLVVTSSYNPWCL